MTNKKNRIVVMIILMMIATISVRAIYEENEFDSIPKPSINATNAIVVDYETKEVYYQKNSDEARPIASMTKLMAMYIVLSEIKTDNLELNTQIPISERAYNMSHNRSYSGLEEFYNGQVVDVDILIKLIMTKSCNASMLALAEYIGGSEENFVDLMNNQSKRWGLNAHFADCCGFEDEGNSVTAQELANITIRLISDFPEILEYSSLKSVIFNGKEFKSTNSLLLNDEYEGIDGLKTGFTNGAGYSFTGTAKRNNVRIIEVNMNSGNSYNRMTDAKELLDYGFKCRAVREKQWFSIIKKDTKLNINISENEYNNSTAEVSAEVFMPDYLNMPIRAVWIIDGNKTVYENVILSNKNSISKIRVYLDKEIVNIELKLYYGNVEIAKDEIEVRTYNGFLNVSKEYGNTYIKYEYDLEFDPTALEKDDGYLRILANYTTKNGLNISENQENIWIKFSNTFRYFIYTSCKNYKPIKVVVNFEFDLKGLFNNIVNLFNFEINIFSDTNETLYNMGVNI